MSDQWFSREPSASALLALAEGSRLNDYFPTKFSTARVMLSTPVRMLGSGIG
jgi:hypothetical protein